MRSVVFLIGILAAFILQTNAASETVSAGVQGYPKVTPETPFTYPPPVRTSTPAIQTGYPKVTPETPFTYPPPVRTSTPAIQTGYPKVTPETPFTYPPPVRTYTPAIQIGYTEVKTEIPFTYSPPVRTSAAIEAGYGGGKPLINSAPDFRQATFAHSLPVPKLIVKPKSGHFPDLFISSSPSEKFLRIIKNQQNHEYIPVMYNSFKDNFQVDNHAASNRETFIQGASRLAVLKRLTPTLEGQHTGAAETSNIPQDDGHYHPHEKYGDAKRAVPGEAGINYLV
ncbi:uncharacterized protein LOC110827969 [Zootermopsis nevadensis]|uniref:Uncharacterized protein n=1 Tax=Zootermopsis nevadensis TaxID=136037 RepID=A0A067RCK2_ZOONE|nr:uncharacterized protein LOC110827969 [Zootermopsis nevadensis]KDR21482.1 hypothetical protein L798_03986 [Zootermopsis nevadensis]